VATANLTIALSREAGLPGTCLLVGPEYQTVSHFETRRLAVCNHALRAVGYSAFSSSKTNYGSPLSLSTLPVRAVPSAGRREFDTTRLFLPQWLYPGSSL